MYLLLLFLRLDRRFILKFGSFENCYLLIIFIIQPKTICAIKFQSLNV